MESLGKIPPHNIEAEQSVLGSMILDREAIGTSIEILRETDSQWFPNFMSCVIC